MIRRSNEIKNENILHSIDTKQILMNLSHFRQATYPKNRSFCKLFVIIQI